MIAWKYSGETSRILVCVNPGTERAIAASLCLDAPNVTKGEFIKAFELVMGSTFRHIPQEMRTEGLKVILHSGEVQIFEY
jgi:hypothetical protein